MKHKQVYIQKPFSLFVKPGGAPDVKSPLTAISEALGP